MLHVNDSVILHVNYPCWTDKQEHRAFIVSNITRGHILLTLKIVLESLYFEIFYFEIKNKIFNFQKHFFFLLWRLEQNIFGMYVFIIILHIKWNQILSSKMPYLQLKQFFPFHWKNPKNIQIKIRKSILISVLWNDMSKKIKDSLSAIT